METCPVLMAERLTKVFFKPPSQQPPKSFLKRISSSFSSKPIPVKAIDNVSLKIDSGESVALLGANGAGKSTLIKLAMGILNPTEGYIKLLGKNPFLERKKCAFEYGAVFGHRALLWKHVPVFDSLLLKKEIYDISQKEFDARFDELCRILDIEKHLSSLPTKLSLGERIRCELAAALLHRPRVLFLDEPTIGLDIPMRHKIRDFLRKLQRDVGTTIILCSHEVADVEMVSDRVIILMNGRSLFDSTPEALRKKILPMKVIRVTTRESDKVFKIPSGAFSKYIKKVQTYQKGDNTTIEISIDPSEIAPLDVINQLPKDLAIMDISIQEPTLEQVLMEVFTASADDLRQ